MTDEVLKLFHKEVGTRAEPLLVAHEALRGPHEAVGVGHEAHNIGREASKVAYEALGVPHEGNKGAPEGVIALDECRPLAHAGKRTSYEQALPLP